MKKIDINKINKKILKLHLEYCKHLRPKVIKNSQKNKKNKKSISENLVNFLCCGYPFDFNKPENNYLKDEYFKFYLNFKKNLVNIDYNPQYKSFRSKNVGEWNGLKLIENLGVNICPYCGMNYISSVNKKNKKVISIASLDHYLPKNEYPFLAMNIYNLIPSCRNCNSIFKYKENDAIIYPFYESLDDLITFNIKNLDVLIDTIINVNQNANIKIAIIPNELNVRINRHIEKLALEERYSIFQNIAKSLIQKRYMYNENYLNNLEKTSLFTKKQLESALIRQDLLNSDEIFLKFKMDIWKQLSDE